MQPNQKPMQRIGTAQNKDSRHFGDRHNYHPVSEHIRKRKGED
ncbi:Uncharacterised protein [uncultured archaeon]|nr:Uncharacterised protein [uncultured archaeon]